MKRKIKFIIAIFICLLFFASCDFFEYVQNEAEDPELVSSREKYIEELSEVRFLEEFREEEQRTYILALNEGINQLNDCIHKDLLEGIFLENKTIILSIKTDKDYLEEEEAKQKLMLEYIEKLKQVSSSDDYLDAEQEIYHYFLELGIAALEENTVLENYEKIFTAYKERIEEIKTKDIYIQEWQVAFCKSVEEYVDFDIYRQAEQEAIKELNNATKERILSLNTYEAMDNVIRDYKTKVYSFLTDAEHYANELATLKQEALKEIKEYRNISEYRETEQNVWNAIVFSFENLISGYMDKALVISALQEHKLILDSLKTNAQYYEEERLELIEECYNDLLSQIDFSHMSEENQIYYQKYCDDSKKVLLEIPLKEEIQKRHLIYKEELFTSLVQAGDANAIKKYKENVIDKLKIYLDETDYRDEQKTEIKNILFAQSVEISSLESFDEIEEEVKRSERLLDEVPTNEELWKEEDEAFVQTLSAKYTTILDMPACLDEANDYYELAQIIDFYAFYQINSMSFERNRFRVKIHFENDKTATWIKNEVYWYCELLRSTIGVDAVFEKNRNLVITLIPYDFASQSNKTLMEPVFKNDCHTYYDQEEDISSRIRRGIDFDDFKYLKYKKEIPVWNTQQLWYALEHEYIPICQENSMAELVLNKAKEILREIITDDMSDEEKIFEIFSWFGRNVQYDFYMGEYNNSSDMNAYPEENISLLNSFFAEGALLDGLAVCSGYAKAYLILLRLEGIESVRILARCHQLKGKNSINGRDDGTGGYGSHEFVYIKMGDEWYFSDIEKSTCEARQDLISYVYLLLPPSFETYGFTVMYPQLNLATSISKIYKKVKFDEKSLLINDLISLKEFMGQFESRDGKYQTSIIVDPKQYFNATNDLVDLIPEGFDIYVLKVGNNISEIIIYN